MSGLIKHIAAVRSIILTFLTLLLSTHHFDKPQNDIQGLPHTTKLKVNSWGYSTWWRNNISSTENSVMWILLFIS